MYRGKIFILAIIVSFSIFLVLGCGDEEPTGPEDVTKHGTTEEMTVEGRSVMIYKTPDWSSSSPVLYLFHSFGEDHTTMLTRYNIDDMADYLYAQGEIKSVAVVMPNFSNDFGGTYHTSSFFNGLEEGFFTEKLIPQVEQNLYGAQVDASKRAVAGLGMGGYGAMKYAMGHPDMFNSVSSHSGILHFQDVKDLIPGVISENPRGLLFAGKIIGEVDGNQDADVMIASGDIMTKVTSTDVEYESDAWAVATEVTNENNWVNAFYPQEGTDFSSNDLANINDPFILGVGSYTNSPKNWTASEWQFGIEPEYKSSRTCSWIWADPDPEEEVASTCYFRRKFIIHIHPDTNTVHLNWSIFPTGHFHSAVEADSFWVYINGEMVKCGVGFNSFPNFDNKIQVSTPIKREDLYQDSLGVIAIKMMSRMGPASDKLLTSSFFAMGAAFSPAMGAPQFPFAPIDTLGNYAGVNLPFDCNGNIDELVWRGWEDYDLFRGLDDVQSSFENIKIYLDAGDKSAFNANSQTQWFNTKLDDLYGIHHAEMEIYSGGHTDHFYNRIRPMLKFHTQ